MYYKIEARNRTEIPNQEIMRVLKEKAGYKYLSILKADIIKEMKRKQITKDHLRK